MRLIDSMAKKVVTVEQAKTIIYGWKLLGKTCAFTNGCFDILHQGHIFSLGQAAKEADFLIVGLNSDASVQRLKGPTRPINNTESRAIVISNLAIVDLVVVFEEDTPLDLIKALMPDVLVKGGDYTLGLANGTLQWFSQFLIVLVLGGVSLILLPIINRQKN